MKRILSLLIVFVIVFSHGLVSFANSEVQITENELKYNVKIYNRSDSLISNLLNCQVFDKESEQVITRAEFVKVVVDLFNVQEKGGKTVYADVPETHNCAPAINVACDLKWISAAEKFNPDAAITYAQAIKIILSAADYAALAEVKGGFPVGYLSVANIIDLTDDVNIEKNNEVSVANATILLYNIMLSNVFEVVSVGEGLDYKTKEITYLEKIYDAYQIHGILTATEYSSVVLNAPFIKDSGKVAIDGVEYFYTGLDASMLGKSVVAYCSNSKDHEKELLFVLPDDNEEIIISAEKFDAIDDDILSYYEDDKLIKADLDPAYKVIYNGRRVEELDKEKMLRGISSSVRLLSNNGDDEYEYIFVDTYTYGTVSSIDYVNGYIALQTPDKLIDLTNDEEQVYSIINAEESKMQIFELVQNTPVAIKVSEDKKLYEIEILSKTVSGIVTAVYSEEKQLDIDDVTYNVSFDIKNDYIDKDLIAAGDSVSMAIGINGELACLISSAVDTRYALLMAADKSGSALSGITRVKLLTDACKMENFELAESVTIDGASKKFDYAESYKFISEQLAEAEADTANPVVVIKYSTDENGYITMLDFASTETSNFGKVLDTRDSLTRYCKNQSYRYRNYGFPSEVMASTSTIVFVPGEVEKRTEEKNFTIGGTSMLSANVGSYVLDAYDIDETGNAAFIVIYLSKGSRQQSALYAVSYMIEKVSKAFVGEEHGVKVQCWTNNQFTTLFIPDSVPITKTSGATTLVPGDVVRFDIVDGKVREVYVDIDFSTGKPVGDTKNQANFEMVNAQHALSFVSGKVYNVGTNSVLISDALDTEGNTLFEFDDLRPYSMNTNIACFDSKTGKVRTIKPENIRTYKGYGQGADNIYLRSDYGIPKTAFIFR